MKINKEKLIKRLSYHNLNQEIQGYGYQYSLKSYIFQVIITMVFAVGTSYFFYMRLDKILILSLVALLCLPIIVAAQYRFIANNNRFEQLVNYMEQMIMSFKLQPKILPALESTLDILEGTMKGCVAKAIEIIRTDTETEDVYEKALGVIEAEFPSTRVITLHRFLHNVERKNSSNYQENLDTLYFDIHSWVTRTYQFQGELSNIKNKVIIILGLSIGITAFFAHLLKTAQDQMPKGVGSMDVIDGGIFQTSTLIFLIIFIILFTFVHTKVNGHWLVNDGKHEKEEITLEYISYVENYNQRRELKTSLIASTMGFAFVATGSLLSIKMVATVGILMIIFILLKPKLSYRLRKKAVEKELQKEFPVWLRDVAINLNHMVVVRAIEQSLPSTSKSLRIFLERFLNSIEKDPTSSAPYRNFLGKFKAAEISTAFKVLYSINTVSSQDSSRQIKDLIQRNQTLLAASEKMRNEDALSGVAFVSMAPMLLLSFKLIIDLGLLLFAFLAMAKGVM